MLSQANPPAAQARRRGRQGTRPVYSRQRPVCWRRASSAPLAQCLRGCPLPEEIHQPRSQDYPHHREHDYAGKYEDHRGPRSSRVRPVPAPYPPPADARCRIPPSRRCRSPYRRKVQGEPRLRGSCLQLRYHENRGEYRSCDHASGVAARCQVPRTMNADNATATTNAARKTTSSVSRIISRDNVARPH